MGLEVIVFLSGLVAFIVIINRYVFGQFLIKMNPTKLLDLPPDYEWPDVVVVIPCYNEGEGVYATLISIVESHYPKDKLKVYIVDDKSTDDSAAWALKAAAEHSNIIVWQNTVNQGKRQNIARVVRSISAPFVVSIDSDVIVHPEAIRELITGFTAQTIAAVGGRVKVRNPNVNWLSKMQTVKYHFGYEYLKSLENSQKQVMCLSGCLTAYRRTVLLEMEIHLHNRNLLGVPIKYGEDRYLTRQIVKAGYQTILNLRAECYTNVPENLAGYFKQQLRWRRSNIVDYIGALSHAHRLRPLIALHYFCIVAIQIIYPFAIAHSILTGQFIPAAMIHMCLLGVLGFIYAMEVRNEPRSLRVSPFWFLAMTIVMPVTYILLTPLALWTLDSASWETRVKTS